MKAQKKVTSLVEDEPKESGSTQESEGSENFETYANKKKDRKGPQTQALLSESGEESLTADSEYEGSEKEYSEESEASEEAEVSEEAEESDE